MVVKRLTTRQLEKAIASEKGKISSAKQRAELQSQLSELRRSQKKGVRLIRRFGRGLRITGKKVGGVLAKQAQRIAAEQERQKLAELRAGKGLGKKIKRKKGKVILKQTSGQKVFVQGLGIVTVPSKTKQQSVRRVRRKPKKRRAPRAEPQTESGFGGLSDLGF